MSDQKISQLSDAGAPQSTDQLVIARSGSSLSLLWSSVLSALNLGTAATHAASDFDSAGAAAAAQAASQPLDSDLTAIAALSTTSFGRALLALADAAALRTDAGLVIGTDVEAHDADLTTIAGLTPTDDDILQRKAGAWTNRTMAQLIADLAALGTTFQPLDSDLTAIAALTTTSFGRGLLTAANAAALGIAAADVGAIATSALDTDGTLAANSDAKVASQKATKTYVDGKSTRTDGWLDDSSETWTFASFAAGPPAVGTFTISGDVRTKYAVGTRIKLTQTTVKYFVVSAAPSYDGTNTTVTISGGTDYTLANAAISANFHSYAVSPQGYPGWFNFAGAATGFSSTTTESYRFAVSGRTCFVWVAVDGTSNATSLTWTLPIPSAQQMFIAHMTKNSGTNANGRSAVNAGSSTVTVSNSIGAAAFTASGGKSTEEAWDYEI